MKRIVFSLVCVMLSTLIYGQSFDDVLKAAKGGDAAAQGYIGYCYLNGNGVSKDEKLAFEWFSKSATQGNPEAQYFLGGMYLYGIGTSKNEIMAFKWLSKSATQGFSEAQFQLAFCYHNGIGTSKNHENAFMWYLKSAEQGNVNAQFQIGYMYSNGIGIEANEVESFRWNRMAAEAGHATAQANLSSCYFEGTGTEIDYEEAYYWAKKSASQNELAGYANLASCYMVGSRKDVKKAIECIDKAIELYINLGRDVRFDKAALLRLYDIKGLIYLEEGELVKAKEMAQLILDINPLYQGREDNRLILYAQTGEISSKDTNLAQTKRVKPSSDVDVEIPQLNHINETTFAVIIANENYEEETQVEYALNDGEIFKTYCKEVIGLPESNIHYRENATLNNILAELDWMKQISTAFGEEAKFIFYYAGHGIPDEASGDAYLLPVDGRGNMLATGYSLNKLYESLGGLTAKSITVFMDACFSGAVRDGGMMASARGVAIKAKQAAPKGNMIVLSAAQGDETAYPYKEKEHGLFTYYLLKKLQETKGDVTLGELSDYITSEVKKRSIIANGKLQTPIVTSSISATDWRNWTLK